MSNNLNKFTRISRRTIGSNSENNLVVNKDNFDIEVSSKISPKDIIDVGDSLFFEKVMFNFENNRFVNSVFLNEFRSKENTDFITSKNIHFNKDESCIKNRIITQEAIYYSKKLFTDGNTGEPINDFFLLTDEYLPAGTDILYYIMTEDNKSYPIKPNDTKPMSIITGDNIFSSFVVKAVLRTNGQEAPVLRGLAVLYYDEYIQNGLGLINPDIGKFTKEDIYVGDDIITLIRDPLNDDKLVQIVGSAEIVNLKYNDHSEEEELVSVETLDTKTSDLKEKADLVYGDYLNSSGVVETVLQQVRTTKK